MQLQKYFQAILAALLLADVARRADAANLRGSEPLGTGLATNGQLPPADSVFSNQISTIARGSAAEMQETARKLQADCVGEFNVVVLYDSSNTQALVKQRTRDALLLFVQRLFADAAAKGRKVRVTIVAFANEAAVVQAPSDNLAEIQNNINTRLLNDVGIGTQMEKGLDLIRTLLPQIDLSHKTSLVAITDGIVDSMVNVINSLTNLANAGLTNRIALGVQGQSGADQPNLLQIASRPSQLVLFPNADAFQQQAQVTATNLFDCFAVTQAPVVPPSSTAVPSSAPSTRPTGKPEDPPEELVNLLNLLWLIALLPHEQKVKKKPKAEEPGEEEPEEMSGNPVMQSMLGATQAKVTREAHEAVAPEGTAWKPRENIGGLAVNMQPVANLPLPKKGEPRNENATLGGLHNWIPQQQVVRKHGAAPGAGEPGTNPPPPPRTDSTISEEPEPEYEVLRTELVVGLIDRSLRAMGYEEGAIARAIRQLQHSGQRTTPELICALPAACAAYIACCRRSNTTPEPNPGPMVFSSNTAAAPLPTPPASGPGSRAVPKPPGL